MIECKNKSLGTIIKRYGTDWSNLMLDGVDFSGRDLTNVILPKDTNLFQRIKNKNLYKTILPKGDYSKYNFDGVNISNSTFTQDSIFSDDIEVFQKIRPRQLGEIKLPTGDYSNYNFKGVIFGSTVFSRDTLLPEETNFFKDTHFGIDVAFPDNVIRNIHNYNLDDVWVNLLVDRYKDILNPKQLEIIKSKYPEAIGRSIYLPYFVSEKEDANNTFAF